MVYITGDIHGSTKRIVKFANQMMLTADDIIIILGDVGVNYFQDERDSFSKATLSHINRELKGEHPYVYVARKDWDSKRYLCMKCMDYAFEQRHSMLVSKNSIGRFAKNN